MQRHDVSPLCQIFWVITHSKLVLLPYTPFQGAVFNSVSFSDSLPMLSTVCFTACSFPMAVKSSPCPFQPCILSQHLSFHYFHYSLNSAWLSPSQLLPLSVPVIVSVPHYILSQTWHFECPAVQPILLWLDEIEKIVKALRFSARALKRIRNFGLQRL